MNNPLKPSYRKLPNPHHRGDRTSTIAVGMAEGRIPEDHEPWFDNMAKTYDMRGKRG